MKSKVPKARLRNRTTLCRRRSKRSSPACPLCCGDKSNAWERLRGTWVGPIRLLLQEGGTIWNVTGATLIRARADQLRAHREELRSRFGRNSLLRMPVTLGSLLRNFTGRHCADVTGEVPSMEQVQDDVQGAGKVEDEGILYVFTTCQGCLCFHHCL